MAKEKVKKPFYKRWWVIAIIVIVIAGVIGSMGDETETASEQSVEETMSKNENITWTEKVKEVAELNETETEKFDKISAYASDYKPTREEISEFENYIIKEYKEGNYIMDISNHEYMLENIFKSLVVEQYYDEGEPMKDFAFDFYQNSKYNYRGVDTMTSESTLSNEEQMNKALEKIGR